MTRRLVQIAAALVVVLAGSGCSGANHGSSAAPSVGAPRQLHSIGELRAAFNAHTREPRLVVLVSPT